ncbi:hypothetical protein N474_22690 [Pseudoalteromonas luteoviolacea CPMOR-2]|uniref:SMP-30/Gluconolactonase/LRE-like region domain-containing protein n=1 Tax=Pseudoalteromonas luteoviolacea DSM 6061 TaxID=1365250 RepID=A0A166V7R3_9GAMM|nr:DUF5074 domain-containing protein [Pseudoalteromonas luteoviolacea]KZN31808.1 hypothetical protein N475_22745 [Pseudoalteromonas luteoviolacea DSM 6061]KZN52780.1 hypothetical protein N474_22690 [Pseudoalteromonas luteoviolacea CPMOR-2]MBE0389734.1 hypothetical protein [Pseudoalteromonas luteoviolacea DSM 6061]
MKPCFKSLYPVAAATLMALTSLSAVASQSSCLSGLYAIDRYATGDESVLYHLDTQSKMFREVPGASIPASNLASNGSKLYTVQRVDRDSNASKIFAFDTATMEQSELATTTSYPIKRSAVSPDGSYLLATSQTYMYQFDLSSGDKTIMGKMKSDDAVYDDFNHGDIAYSADGNLVYVLNAKALYVLNEADMTLSKIGDHNLHWASGLAVDDSGVIYASARERGENAKIYTLDPQTAQATFYMNGPAHIADLSYSSGCGNSLPIIAHAFQIEVNKAKQYWMDDGQTGKVANLVGFKDNSVNFNDQGFPVESKDKLNKHNKFTKNPNANRCARMWNNFLDHQYVLNRNGKGRKKNDGSTKWYFSTEDGAYKVIRARKGVCEYGYATGEPGKILYNSKTGLVTVE